MDFVLHSLSRPFRLYRFSCLALLVALCMLGISAVAAMQIDRAAVVQHAQGKYGKAGMARLQNWFALLDRSAGLADTQAQLRAINAFWNIQVQEAEDINVWRQDDYWATPLELLGRGMGDCEDFVLGKYFSLVHVGVPADKLRLIYVRARINNGAGGIAHMVLGYYETPQSDPLILDNLKHTILPASKRNDLIPVFSFNADGVYVAGAAPGSASRISGWRGVLARMQQEGFLP